MLNFESHLEAIKSLKNYGSFLKDDLSRQTKGKYILQHKSGLCFGLRSRKKARISDIDIFAEVVLHDEYRLKSFLRTNSVVVDVGGHIGFFACSSSRLVEKGKVFVYEPVPENFKMLESNVRSNTLENVVCVNKAVSGNGDPIRIYIEDWNTGAHSQYAPAGNKNFCDVETVTLHDILDENGLSKIDFMKVDCEGGEYEFLLNASEGDLRRVEKMFIEQHITDQTVKLYPENILLKFLEDRNFKVRILKKILYPGEGKFLLIEAVQDG